MKKNLIPISQITSVDYEELDMLPVRGGGNGGGPSDAPPGDNNGTGCNTDYKGGSNCGCTIVQNVDKCAAPNG